MSQKNLEIAVVFSLKEEKGALRTALKAFEDLDISLTHIESRTSKTNPGTEYDFYAECVCYGERRADLVNNLEKYSTSVKIVQDEFESEKTDEDLPWFPKTIYDVRRCCTNLFKYGGELASDHPGFGDAAYVERRKYIAKVATEYY